MYVRKFEGETLDETLQNIKAEFGPDAIILKTVTNNGIKGAFKKKKIEITAAITEKSYTDKARVDHVLDAESKEKFYNAPSSYISNMIESHSSHITDNSSVDVKNPGYGKVALNKQVQSAKDFGKKIKSGLDDFLGKAGPQPTVETIGESVAPKKEIVREQVTPQVDTSRYENRIEKLERQILELTNSIESLEKKEPTGLYHLRVNLAGHSIDENYIQFLIKKAVFELSEQDLKSSETVFDFALREMAQEIRTEMPLFSKVDEKENVVTVLISETSVGQSSMIMKLGSMVENSVIVQRLVPTKIVRDTNLSEKVFDLDVRKTHAQGEIFGECRKAAEQKRNVFIDYKVSASDVNDVKNFIDGLKRSFDKVQVFLSLSAINSEVYNRKVVNKYSNISNGIVINHLDNCLDFGALFNLQTIENALPFIFFGTGEVIPDDIEVASKERILGGIFNLK
jgi:flagellar biosynthesis protein FlhF